MKQISMTKHAPVGVIGLGDLGKKLAAQVLAAGQEVRAFDPVESNRDSALFTRAVDPTLDVTRFDDAPFHVAEVGEILKTCKLVHWAVPSRQLVQLPDVPADCTVILHDSVMANSAVALAQRPDAAQIVVAHCLMNEAGRVLVATEFGDHAEATRHFEDIGLSPRPTSVKAHDTLMTRTQGIFALLIELGLKEELDKAFAAGNLTPSALELRAALTHREARWTQQTLDSILGNPELAPFVDELARVVAKRQGLPTTHE